MKKAILSLAILVSLSLVFPVSCGNNAQPPSGELPNWKVGDTWTTTPGPANESTFTYVTTVTDEQVYSGINCYVTTTQSSNDNMIQTSAVDKTTLEPISIRYTLSTNESIYMIRNMSYNYSVKPYPLSVGKTWTVTVNRTMTSYHTDSPPYRDTYSYIYKVEKIESITVSAGTFQCFKIVQYDEENSIIASEWITDVTKGNPVEMINEDNIEILELFSYSLSK